MGIIYNVKFACNLKKSLAEWATFYRLTETELQYHFYKNKVTNQK